MADRIAVIGEVAPSEQDITRLSFGERVKGYFARIEAESFYKKYGVTKKDVQEGARFIEEVTGLKFDEKIREGKLRISLLDAKEYDRLLESEFVSTLKEIGGVRKGKVLEVAGKEFKYAEILDAYKQLYGEAPKELSGTVMMGYYRMENSTMFIRNDAMDVAISNSLAKREKDLDSKLGQNDSRKILEEVSRPIVMQFIIHEMTHEVMVRNNPSLHSETSIINAETLKTGLELEVADEKSKAQLDSRMKELEEKIAVLKAWNEAVARYTTSQVMEKLGLKKVHNPKDYYIEKGEGFLDEVRKSIGENTISIIVKNPPASMEEIENPQKYVERLHLKI